MGNGGPVRAEEATTPGVRNGGALNSREFQPGETPEEAGELRSVNPATGETIAVYPEMTSAEVEIAIGRAHSAHLQWRDLTFDQRARLVRELATLLRSRTDEYAELMALEMGKILAEGRAEVEKSAWVCEFYADRAEEYLQPEPVRVEAHRGYILHRPVGLVLSIMPWNFPFWQVLRSAAPALMAGNGVLLKHAPNVQGCALALEEAFLAAGFPKGLMGVLRIPTERVEEVVADPRVRVVTLTGGARAGREVASLAGRHLKKCIMELGGSDPYVILADADLEKAVAAGTESRLRNAGQSCIAAKRFIVVEEVADRFQRLLLDRMKQYRVGDPFSAEPDMGPLARLDLRDRLHANVLESVSRGARLLLGGEIPPGPGAYYPPTLLTGVRRGMPAYHEEMFGPVAVIIRAADEADALRIANDTPFGLGAAVFTGDRRRGEHIAAEVFDAGACYVNRLVRSDPRLPFGGVKDSGFGRELSRHGILEFVNVKTVVVD